MAWGGTRTFLDFCLGRSMLFALHSYNLQRLHDFKPRHTNTDIDIYLYFVFSIISVNLNYLIL